MNTPYVSCVRTMYFASEIFRYFKKKTLAGFAGAETPYMYIASSFVSHLRMPAIVREQFIGQAVIAAFPVVQLQHVSLPCPGAASPVVLHDGSCSPHARSILSSRSGLSSLSIVVRTEVRTAVVYVCSVYRCAQVLAVVQLSNNHQHRALSSQLSAIHAVGLLATNCCAFWQLAPDPRRRRRIRSFLTSASQL